MTLVFQRRYRVIRVKGCEPATNSSLTTTSMPRLLREATAGSSSRGHVEGVAEHRTAGAAYRWDQPAGDTKLGCQYGTNPYQP